ncbi:sterol desaturase family protein [bacterium SCSIO 12741]|nr:sterol desaturase family protein [bacterium SCSIO 12741]
MSDAPVGLIILSFILSFIAMEAVAWSTHKFIMHGPLWSWHQDHHQPTPGFWQRNDRFFLLFAIPGALLMVGGSVYHFPIAVSAGAGITAYGVTYFLLHDLLIHRRLVIFKSVKNPYLRAIRKAHQVHHRHRGQNPGECYGLLVVPIRYFREAYRKA